MSINEFVKRLSVESMYSSSECQYIASIVLIYKGKLSIAYECFDRGGSIVLNQYIEYLKIKMMNGEI